MAGHRLHLDERALERVVTERARAAAVHVGEEIADAVRRQSIEVGAENGDGDEYALPVEVSVVDDVVRVALAHPAGKAVQAKHGALTRAAASLGLEVHR